MSCWAVGTTVAVVLLALGACGFEPLYGRSDDTARAATISAVEIAPIRDRTGHVLREYLIRRLGKPGNRPRYTLTLAVSDRTAPVLIQIDDTATRFNLTLSGSFELQDNMNGEVVYQGSAKAIGSYNQVESEFATIVAEDDARKEAARILGDEIRALLLVYFSRQPDSG